MVKKQKTETVLTTAQQQLLSACDPLLVQSKSWYLAYATLQTQRFMDWVTPLIVGLTGRDLVCGGNKTGVHEFLREGDNHLMEDSVQTLLKYCITNNGYENDCAGQARVWVNEENRKKFTEKGATFYHDQMLFKLTQHVLKYVTAGVVSVADVMVSRGVKGYEIQYVAHYENGTTRLFYTSAIEAGGHTIQRLHYRYITK